MLLTQTYAPKDLDGVLGHEEAKRRLRQWILQWTHGKPQKPLLLYGPSGIGKTALAYALAGEFDLELLEINASMLRNRKRVEQLLGGATSAGSLYGRHKLLLIDDVDIFEKSDRGGIAALQSFLREVRHPFFLTAGNAWEKKLAPVRMQCELVKLRRPSRPSIEKHLKKITEHEKLEVPASTLEEIATYCNGDVRSALIDLQVGRKTDRDREEDIFHRVRRIFKATRYAEAKESAYGNVDYDLLKLWMDENIPYEYTHASDLARAYAVLSRTDVMEGRIRRTKWVLLRYCFDLLTAGIALSKQAPYLHFTQYQFPSYLKQMSASIARRALRKKTCQKIASRTHSSVHDAASLLPLLQPIAKHDPEVFAVFYRMDEEELAYLLETSIRNVRK